MIKEEGDVATEEIYDEEGRRRGKGGEREEEEVNRDDHIPVRGNKDPTELKKKETKKKQKRRRRWIDGEGDESCSVCLTRKLKPNAGKSKNL